MVPVVKCTRDDHKLKSGGCILTNSFAMLERGEHANSESQLSHHAHVLVTCSKIHERLLHCGVREERKRDQREIERERSERGSEREREREGERWHANTYQFRIAIE